MATEPPRRRRKWLPKISLKTAFFVFGLICTYLACWKITIDYGVADVEGTYDGTYYEPSLTGGSLVFHEYESAWSPIAFVVAVNDYSGTGFAAVPWRRVHYFWTPWCLVRIPIDYEIDPPVEVYEVLDSDSAQQ